jgi:hypothetical protein
MPRTGLYVPVDVCFPDDERIEQVGLEGAGLYVFALCVAKRTLSDGRVTRTKLHRFGASDELIGTLIASGLMSADGADAVRITAWLDHNDPADKIADRRAKDAARKRQARASRPRDVQPDTERTQPGRADTEKTERREDRERVPSSSQSEISTRPQAVDGDRRRALLAPARSALSAAGSVREIRPTEGNEGSIVTVASQDAHQVEAS